MGLMDKLTEDMKVAMKNKEKLRLSVIRMIKATLQNEIIQKGNQPLSEEDELTVLSRELKQRKDSLTEFRAAGRDDLCEQLEKEIVVVEAYLPQQLNDSELESLVKATIEEVGAASAKDFGKVMGKIMPKVKGKADGNKVQQFVKQHLS